MWDKSKAIEAILYLANRLTNPTKLQIFKLLYLADKLHLSRYGRFIIRDQYVAMKRGPVPSHTFNMIRSPSEIEGNLQVGEDNRAIYPCRDANPQKFSQSDIECLDETLRLYGRASAGQLIELTHDQLWRDLTNGGQQFNNSAAPQSVSMPLERIVDTLPKQRKTTTLQCSRPSCPSVRLKRSGTRPGGRFRSTARNEETVYSVARMV